MIKIIRLITGEDIIGDIIGKIQPSNDKDDEKIIIQNPLTAYVDRDKKSPSLYMIPWIPIDLTEEDTVNIPMSQITTMVNPRLSIISHYNDIVEALNNLSHSKDDDLLIDVGLDDSVSEDDDDDTKPTIH